GPGPPRHSLSVELRAVRHCPEGSARTTRLGGGGGLMISSLPSLSPSLQRGREPHECRRDSRRHLLGNAPRRTCVGYVACRREPGPHPPCPACPRDSRPQSTFQRPRLRQTADYGGARTPRPA